MCFACNKIWEPLLDFVCVQWKPSPQTKLWILITSMLGLALLLVTVGRNGLLFRLCICACIVKAVYTKYDTERRYNNCNLYEVLQVPALVLLLASVIRNWRLFCFHVHLPLQTMCDPLPLWIVKQRFMWWKNLRCLLKTVTPANLTQGFTVNSVIVLSCLMYAAV